MAHSLYTSHERPIWCCIKSVHITMSVRAAYVFSVTMTTIYTLYLKPRWVLKNRVDAQKCVLEILLKRGNTYLFDLNFQSLFLFCVHIFGCCNYFSGYDLTLLSSYTRFCGFGKVYAFLLPVGLSYSYVTIVTKYT